MRNNKPYFINHKQWFIRRWSLQVVLGLGLAFFTPSLTRAQEGGGNPTAQCETCTNCCPSPDPAVTPSVQPEAYECVEKLPVPMPTVVPPAFCPGEKNGNTVTYTVSAVKWDPDPSTFSLPLVFPAMTTHDFKSQAYVIVTSSDPADCPYPGSDGNGRLDIGGNFTWTVISPGKKEKKTTIDLHGIQDIINTFSGFMDKFPGNSWKIEKKPAWTGEYAEENSLVCCPEVGGKSSVGHKKEISVTVHAEAGGNGMVGPLPIPYAPGLNKVIKIYVKYGGEVTLDISGKHEMKCEDESIYCFSPSVSLTVKGGIEAAILCEKCLSASLVLSITGGSKASLCYNPGDGSFSGGMQGCFGPIAVTGTVNLFGVREYSVDLKVMKDEVCYPDPPWKFGL